MVQQSLFWSKGGKAFDKIIFWLWQRVWLDPEIPHTRGVSPRLHRDDAIGDWLRALSTFGILFWTLNSELRALYAKEMSTKGRGDLSPYNSCQCQGWFCIKTEKEDLEWKYAITCLAQTLMGPMNVLFLSLLRSGVEDNDDDAGGSDDPRIESDMNRESWHVGCQRSRSFSTQVSHCQARLGQIFVTQMIFGFVTKQTRSKGGMDWKCILSLHFWGRAGLEVIFWSAIRLELSRSRAFGPVADSDPAH